MVLIFLSLISNFKIPEQYTPLQQNCLTLEKKLLQFPKDTPASFLDVFARNW